MKQETSHVFELKPITSSSYTFADLRESGVLYVDKTAYIHKIVSKKPKGIFFLARPRRFGKSLTLSTILNAQLASIPGKLHVKTEPYYHTVATMFLRFAGAMVRTEEWVSTGIIDNTVAISNLLYVFEFKTDKTAAAAMKQIHDKNYYAQWLTSGKKIILFAMSFDTENKCVSDYLTEEIN